MSVMFKQKTYLCIVRLEKWSDIYKKRFFFFF